MLNWLAKLRGRRGFTLVELIAVIAIIAVLAAILVPTLLGMVTKSKVASANSTAASVQKAVTEFFLIADTQGFGMKSSAVERVNIKVNRQGSDTVWECTGMSDDSFQSNDRSIVWGGGGQYVNGNALTGETDGEVLFLSELSSRFPTLDRAAMVVVIRGGAVTLTVFCDEVSDYLAAEEYPADDNGSAPSSFAWDGDNQGVSPNGLIIGTSPVIQLG